MSFQFEDYCPQLFFLRKGCSGPPEPLASSVLVNINGYYLLTANHVFEDKTMDEVVIFMGDDRIIRLYGDVGYYLPVGDQDNIDIAVLQLPDTLGIELSQRFKFLHHKNVAFTGLENHISEFFFYGFIAHQTQLEGKIFESDQFGLLTTKKEIPADETSGFNDNEHLWLTYNRRKQSFIDSEQRNLGPNDLRGLSGGGVWAVTQSATTDRPATLQLAGIMIEQRVKKGFIIASRVNMLIGILYQRFGINPASYIHFS